MKKGFFLLAILLFPSIIYLLFSLGEHHVEKLGSFGSFEIGVEGDTIYQSIPTLELTSSDGKQIGISEFRNRALVLNVFRFPCDEDCRKKGVTLANYLNELGEPEKWAILNLCITDRVSKEELSRVSVAHEFGMKNWHFASANSAQALDSFLQYVYVETGNTPSIEELPNNYFVLIDQSQVVRAFFNSRIHKENRKLEDAIKLVLQEQYLSWKSK